MEMGYKEYIKEQEEKVKVYFRWCPLCFKEDSMSFEWGIRKSFMLCKDCGAKWYLHYSWGDFKGAQLVNVNVDEKGNDLLGREHDPEFWLRMSLRGREELSMEKDRICVKCKKKIPWDANICPYCAYDYRTLKQNKKG